MSDLVTVVMARVREAESAKPTTLRCSRCHKWHPDEAFSTDPRCTGRRGRRTQCRWCDATTRAALRARRRAQGIPVKQSSRKTTRELQAFWLERFSMAEIREMAAALELTLGRTP